MHTVLVNSYNMQDYFETLYSIFSVQDKLNPVGEFLFFESPIELKKLVYIDIRGDEFRLIKCQGGTREAIPDSILKWINEDSNQNRSYIYDEISQKIIWCSFKRMPGWYRYPWRIKSWKTQFETRCGVIIPTNTGNKFYLIDVTSNYNPLSVFVFFNLLDKLCTVGKPSLFGMELMISYISSYFDLNELTLKDFNTIFDLKGSGDFIKELDSSPINQFIEKLVKEQKPERVMVFRDFTENTYLENGKILEFEIPTIRLDIKGIEGGIPCYLLSAIVKNNRIDIDYVVDRKDIKKRSIRYIDIELAKFFKKNGYKVFTDGSIVTGENDLNV